MDKKSQLQVLCEEKIPAILRGVPSKEVFKENVTRTCDKTCSDYYPARGFSNNNLCEQDLQPIVLPFCRLGYPPIAQSSPKYIGEEKNYGTASFRLRHGLPINGSTGGVDIGD